MVLIVPVLISSRKQAVFGAGRGANYIMGPFSPPQTVLIYSHQVTESSRIGVAA